MLAAVDPIPKWTSENPRQNAYPFWAMRFWHGMLLGVFFRTILVRLFRMHPRRVIMAVIVFFVASLNSLLHRIEKWCFGRAVDATEIDQPPIFVVGHWRSGTTLLHELLALDERLAFPSTYECFAPSHFLLTGRVIPPLIRFLLPAKRPTDDMVLGFGQPQEDEFALMAMGAPSPMLRLAFPNDPPPYLEFLDMEGVAEADLLRWKEVIQRFVRAQMYAKHKPLVLKSPPHTGRVSVLSELFPGAKFVHIVRDPYSLFASTCRLWSALERIQGFQTPRYEHLEEYVLCCLERMYAGFERQRVALDESQICEIRYEELVRDPVGQLRRVYEHLRLGDFELVRAKVEAYAAAKREYRANRHELSPRLRSIIRQRWAAYFEKYGYAEETVPVG